MFVAVMVYTARTGEEDAIIALYDDWQRNQQSRAKGYLSGELLRNIDLPREFIAIMRFESLEAAKELTKGPERNAWYERLVSLFDGVPVQKFYKMEWH